MNAVKTCAIATPEMEGRILPILEGIARALRLEVDTLPSTDLLGAALFLGHLSRLPGFEENQEIAEALFGRAVETADGFPGPQLYGGYVGLGWHAAHLGSLLGWDVEDVCADLDQLLLKDLRPTPDSPWHGDYDLISGLAGIAVYGAERGSTPILTEVFRHLFAKAELVEAKGQRGLAWRTLTAHLPEHMREGPPEGFFNLGAAHGNHGAIAALALIADHGIEAERAARIIDKATGWLSAVRQVPSTGGSYFARAAFQGPPTGSCFAQTAIQDPTNANRIGWCYGDLGASLLLVQAARRVHNTNLEAIAMDAARLAAHRPLSASGALDQSLCHGNVGNSHIFHRLHQLTGNPMFFDAAQAYLLVALDAYAPEIGFAGFTVHQPDQARLFDRDFLLGTCGIGLGLLAALGRTESSWDRLMMLDLAPSHSHQTPP